jgi:hypothetical protein
MYKLLITIKEAEVALPALSTFMYVSTSIGGFECLEAQTDTAKMTKGRAQWGKQIFCEFNDIEPTIPSVISMSVYQKRIILKGYKLLGTIHFSLADLRPVLNKGSIQGHFRLHVLKGQMVSSCKLLVQFNLYTLPKIITINQRKYLPLTNQALDKNEPMKQKDVYSAQQVSSPIASEPLVNIIKLCVLVLCSNVTFVLLFVAVLVACGVTISSSILQRKKSTV